jgi:rod shape-determining protein MreD
MINDLFKYAINFTLVLFIQILIINNIPIVWFINPLFYIVFIITLPINVPGWLLLVSGFFLGLIVDLAANTPGMNTIATLTIAYMRPYLLSAMVPRDDYQPSIRPIPTIFGFPWFIQYAGIMVFQYILPTLFKITVSAIFSLILILVVQMFKMNQSKAR